MRDRNHEMPFQPVIESPVSVQTSNGQSTPQTAAPMDTVHISVCVCTFKRPALLADLLRGLLNQTTEGKFTYSIVLVDNDRHESGRPTVDQFLGAHPETINYLVEPEQSIALARNRAVAHATGAYVAFIDDDEVPIEDWLLKMYNALITFQADGVLGPVKPRFAVVPPEWALKANIFDRPNSQDYPSGLVLHWSQTGTGNALIQRRVFDEVEGPFKRDFASGGEDIDFFRRAVSQGKVFVWCAEAVTYETVPVERTRVFFQLKRALLRGKASLATSFGNPFGILKSVAACGVYTMLLPVSLIIGRHLFLKYLVKNCDHLGKLLASVGIDLVKEKYVSK
jgi:glycosyltransferase involved in cell wall biosynthesis